MKRMTMPLLPALLLGACVFGGRPEICGEPHAGGGPAVLSTKDQELCEIVRLRVLMERETAPSFTRARLDHLVDRSLAWEMKGTLAALLEAVRADAGDGFAGAMQRAFDAVRTKSSRPLPADCPDAERCLVRGAARGARIALLTAEPSPQPRAR